MMKFQGAFGNSFGLGEIVLGDVSKNCINL